jgi:DNA primase
VHCCFHPDTHPSLRINIISGGFICFGCGAKGGDIVAFHSQRFGLPFVEVITHFGAWTDEK